MSERRTNLRSVPGLETGTVGADPPGPPCGRCPRGRPLLQGDVPLSLVGGEDRATDALRSHRGDQPAVGARDGMHERGNDRQHGKPLRCRRVTGNRDSASDYPSGGARPNFRFYTLYDKMYRADVLWVTYRRCWINGGPSH